MLQPFRAWLIHLSFFTWSLLDLASIFLQQGILNLGTGGPKLKEAQALLMPPLPGQEQSFASVQIRWQIILTNSLLCFEATLSIFT
jgi:hypothetical protein